jgi:hypothetical protein
MRNEVNSIRAAYMRADLLPEPHRTKIRDLLREYVDVRLEEFRSENTEQAITQLEELHNQLWFQATASVEKTPNPDLAAPFIQSLNEIITAHTNQVIAGKEFRIPGIIWIVLYAITVLAAGSVGYQSGMAGRNRQILAVGLILAFAAVMFLIEDLDRPIGGFFRVSQTGLVDLQKKINTRTP